MRKKRVWYSAGGAVAVALVLLLPRQCPTDSSVAGSNTDAPANEIVTSRLPTGVSSTTLVPAEPQLPELEPLPALLLPDVLTTRFDFGSKQQQQTVVTLPVRRRVSVGIQGGFGFAYAEATAPVSPPALSFYPHPLAPPMPDLHIPSGEINAAFANVSFGAELFVAYHFTQNLAVRFQLGYLNWQASGSARLLTGEQVYRLLPSLPPNVTMDHISDITASGGIHFQAFSFETLFTVQNRLAYLSIGPHAGLNYVRLSPVTSSFSYTASVFGRPFPSSEEHEILEAISFLFPSFGVVMEFGVTIPITQHQQILLGLRHRTSWSVFEGISVMNSEIAAIRWGFISYF